MKDIHFNSPIRPKSSTPSAANMKKSKKNNKPRLPTCGSACITVSRRARIPLAIFNSFNTWIERKITLILITKINNHNSVNCLITSSNTQHTHNSHNCRIYWNDIRFKFFKYNTHHREYYNCHVKLIPSTPKRKLNHLKYHEKIEKKIIS